MADTGFLSDAKWPTFIFHEVLRARKLPTQFSYEALSKK